MSLDIKLVAYAPGGARLGELPLPLQIDSADPLSDTPSLTMKYAESAAGHALLQNPIEVAREVYDDANGAWFEPENSRFILVRHEGDRLEATGAMNYICPGYAWMLGKAIVYPVAKSIAEGQVADASGTEDEKRKALNAAEDRLAQSYGLSTNRPVAYDTFAPQDTANIWVDTTNTSSLKYMVYSESTNKWELFGTHTAATVDAYNAFLAHQETQAILRDAQSRTRATKRAFQGKHAGQIIRELIDETVARGDRLRGMTYSFTATHDSAGNPWPLGGGSVEVNTGTSLLRLLQSFVDAGQLDFNTTGRTLNVYVQDTELSRDSSSGIALRYGVDIDEAPDKGTLEHVAGELLFLGDEGFSFTRSNPEAPAPWGVWEASVSQSGVASEGMGALLATKALEAAANVRTERTRALSFHDEAGAPRPYVDYRPGDFVTAPGPDGSPEKQRIFQITLSKDGTSGAVTGNVVLHDRFLEREIRLARQQEALIGGTAGTSGTGGGSTDPERYIDQRTPEAPKFLQASADTSPRKGGGYESFLGLSWWWSRMATNGTSMEGNLTGFDVQFRMNMYNSNFDGNTYVWRSWPQVPGNVWNAAHGPVDYYDAKRNGPAVYELRVRAVGQNGRLSPWSEVIYIEVPLDAEPPKAPSQPIVRNVGPMIVADWDGLSFDGGNPPLDFSHLEIEETEIPSDAVEPLSQAYLESLPWTRLPGQRLVAAGAFNVHERTFDKRYAYRFVALDQNENESAPSAPSGVAIPKGLVDTSDISAAVEAEAQETETAMGELETKLNTKISTDPVQLYRLQTGEVQLDTAVAQEIWSRKVVAKKVQANEVAIGTGSNLLANGAGELGDNTNFETWTSWDSAAWVKNSGAMRSWGTNLTTPFTTSQSMKIDPSTPYLIRAAATGTLSGSLGQIEVIFYDLAGVELGAQIALSVSSTLNWSFYEGTVTSPVGAATAKLRITSNMAGSPADAWIWWANLQLTAQVKSSLIVKGGITTDHLAALSVKTGQLDANAVTAAKADITSLKSAIIVSDVFQGKSFYGGLFEGAKFRTHSNDWTGVIMGTSGLRSYNVNAEKTFDINADTGEVLIAGRLKSGTGNGSPNIIISSADSSYNAKDQGIWFTNDGGPYGWGNPTKKAVPGVFTLADATQADTDYPLQLRGNGGGGLKVYSSILLAPQEGRSPMLHSDTIMRIRVGGEFTTWSDQDTVIGVATDKVIRFERNYGAYNPSTGSASNMFIDANGYIFKSTSAKKYKRHLQHCMPDEKVLNTPTLLWQDEWACAEFERLKDLPHPLSQEDQSTWDRINMRWHLGTTAEDAIENGLEHLVTYDNEGNIDGFEYDRFAFMLTPFLKILWEDYKQRTGKGAPAPTPKPAGPPPGYHI